MLLEERRVALFSGLAHSQRRLAVLGPVQLGLQWTIFCRLLPPGSGTASQSSSHQICSHRAMLGRHYGSQATVSPASCQSAFIYNAMPSIVQMQIYWVLGYYKQKADSKDKLFRPNSSCRLNAPARLLVQWQALHQPLQQMQTKQANLHIIPWWQWLVSCKCEIFFFFGKTVF